MNKENKVTFLFSEEVRQCLVNWKKKKCHEAGVGEVKCH